MIASAFFTATLFNKNDVFQINIWKIIFPIILLFLLWCVSSWSLTSLFDGEGDFQDIFIATAYALIPILITELALIFISHGIVLEEAAFYDLLRGIGIVWTGFLLFMGMIVTHQYTFLKSILISLFSILGICIIIYVGLLFINLLQQMTGFGVGLYTEWSLRHQ